MSDRALEAAPRPQRTSAQRPPTIQVAGITVGGLPTRRVPVGSDESIIIRNPDSGEDQRIVIYTTDGPFELAWK